MRKQMGLDRRSPSSSSAISRCRDGPARALHDHGQPVVKDLRERLPASLELTFAALLIALSLSIPLGILAALRPGSAVDHARAPPLLARVCVPTSSRGCC